MAEIPQKWYVIFTKSYQEALFSIYSIIGVDNFGPLVYVMSAKFLHYKGIIFSFVINKHLWGERYFETMYVDLVVPFCPLVSAPHY